MLGVVRTTRWYSFHGCAIIRIVRVWERWTVTAAGASVPNLAHSPCDNAILFPHRRSDAGQPE
jgi:hypothetical protein